MLLFDLFYDKLNMYFYPRKEKRDFMKAFLKILKILGIFFGCLMAISLVWYLIESVNSTGDGANSVVDYVLYLIGYGDLEIKNHYSLTVFSVISLFTLTLMSSVFTVNLFEIRSKAKIMPTISLSEGPKDYEAHASIKTIGKDIYDVTAVLIAKVGDELYSEEIYVPFVPKRTVHKLKLSFDIGSPLYKYMRAKNNGASDLTPLIITLTYTDIEGGQEYKSCAKFNYSKGTGDFGYARKDLWLDIEEYLCCSEFSLDLAKAAPINDEDISLTFEKTNGMQKHTNVIHASVNMTSRSDYEPKSFVMACLSDFGETDWRKYADLGYHLDLEYLVQGRMTVTLEFKYGDKNLKVYRQSLHAEGQAKHFSIDLSSDAINYDELANVRELCFTVFYEDTDPDTRCGEFTVRNCALRLLDTVKNT